LPSVNQLYTEFKDRGLAVVLINFREDPAKVRRTVEAERYVAPVLLDRSGEVTGKRYGVFGPPTAYFIDRRGQIVGRIVGSRPWDSPAARDLIAALLAAPP